MAWYSRAVKNLRNVVKNPVYSIATSLVPGLDISNTLTQGIDRITGITPGGTASDWINTALRAGGGYLQGGTKGAAIGALGGLLNNYTPAATWVNNLSNSGALGGLLEAALSGGVKATGNAANPLYGAGMGVLQDLFPSVPGGYTIGQNATGGTLPFAGYGSTAPNTTTTTTPPGATGAGGATTGGATTGGATTGGATTPPPTSGGTLSQILAAFNALPTGAKLGLGAGALGLLGSLTGSENNDASFNPPPLWGTTDANNFKGYNYANYGAPGYAPRTPIAPPITQQDYYTYGQRPEQLFFTSAAPPAAISPAAPGLRRGGTLRNAAAYIRGTGDGRADRVPIDASHGEYMMDAETVSLLGNGNNEAGARKLDGMRKRLRTHKGKALSRGRFSPNAKAPEQYMGAR